VEKGETEKKKTGDKARERVESPISRERSKRKLNGGKTSKCTRGKTKDYLKVKGEMCVGTWGTIGKMLQLRKEKGKKEKKKL